MKDMLNRQNSATISSPRFICFATRWLLIKVARELWWTNQEYLEIVPWQWTCHSLLKGMANCFGSLAVRNCNRLLLAWYLKADYNEALYYQTWSQWNAKRIRKCLFLQHRLLFRHSSPQAILYTFLTDKESNLRTTPGVGSNMCVV
jgi:hypothetical protein